MSGNILTPISVWNSFTISETPSFQLVDEKVKGDLIYRKIYIDGRTVGDDKVKIFGKVVRENNDTVQPAILVLFDFEKGLDENLIAGIAKAGYTAVAIDLGGCTQKSKYFTIYPSSIDYANYEIAKENIDVIKTDAIKTCWYEWAVAVRYVLAYVKSQKTISGVGVVGIRDGARVLWKALFNNEDVDCAVFFMDAGWKAYKGIPKFAGESEPQFNDEMLKFVAGIEPQAYAKHVKCPCLLLAPTNSDEYDCDRASDTIIRINENAYRGECYSVGNIDTVDYKAIDHARVFCEKFLKENGEVDLPFEPEVKCEIENGQIVITATVDPKGLSRPSIYLSEEIIVPEKRAWIKLTNGKKIADGEYKFVYNPYPNSKIVTLFVKASYKNGFALCSNIVAKRFKCDEVKNSHKEKIIFSGRSEEFYSVFSAILEKTGSSSWRENDKNCLKIKKGPMAIDGVTATGGLRTFKICAEKYRPDDYAILMLDVYAKQPTELTVKLIKDFYGNHVEYCARQTIKGGKIWHNVRLEMSKFKTEEGMILKSYKDIDAIEIYVSGDYLVNNILWI